MLGFFTSLIIETEQNCFLLEAEGTDTTHNKCVVELPHTKFMASAVAWQSYDIM